MIKTKEQKIKEILAIVESVQGIEEACYSPSHIVFDDYNLNIGSILFCLNKDRWVEYIKEKSDKFIDEWEFLAFMQNCGKALDALGKLLNYMNEDLEAAQDFHYGEGDYEVET